MNTKRFSTNETSSLAPGHRRSSNCNCRSCVDGHIYAPAHPYSPYCNCNFCCNRTYENGKSGWFLYPLGIIVGAGLFMFSIDYMACK